MSDIPVSDSKSTILNYINYYLLEGDVDRYFKSESYGVIFWAEVIAIAASVIVFYFNTLLQIFSYYFLGPSLTKEDLDTMNQERVLLEKYNNLKSKYVLTCTTNNTLGYKNLQTQIITEALTLSGQPVINCSNLSI